MVYENEVNLGFGEMESCLDVLGITCKDCRYFEACVGSDYASDVFLNMEV